MNVSDLVLEQIMEIRRQREGFKRQAEQKLAAFEGAIQALEQLYEKLAALEAQNEIDDAPAEDE